MSRIRRSSYRSNYLTVGNAVCRDRRISHRARGILIWILSLPPEATVSADDLAAHPYKRNGRRDGRDAVRTAMRELAGAGYARLDKYRSADGRIRSEWIVADATEHLDPPKTDFQAPESPEPENPTPVQPTPVWQASKRKE